MDSTGHEAGNLDGDLEFLYRIAVKVNQIREDIGSAGAVLATSIERVMLGETVPIRSLDELRACANR